MLKKKHQLVNDGTIYERDITTIGAVNQFAPGQIPIYRSGNFIITVRDDRRGMNQYNTKKWEKGLDGDVWTLSTVDKMTSDDVLQDDTKIVLKNDYYDFREFAYYGSLTELFRASINDMLERFPGELFAIKGSNGVGGVYYTVSHTEDFEAITTKERLGGDDFYEVSNPFGINIHTEVAPPGADPLKFFANEGFKNYEVIKGTTHEDIIKWEVIPFDPCKTDPWCKVSGEADTVDGRNPQPIQFTAKEGGGEATKEEDRRKVAEITITTTTTTYTFYAYLGDNGVIHYLYKKDGTKYDDLHIRPKGNVITEFYNGCNDLQRLMFNQDTNPRYKGVFSVIGENDYGYTRKLEEFVYPTSAGGYNPAVDSEYAERLIQIGEFYDERFTDNLYRSMTHESIKNFDWTYTREYNEGDEVEYVRGGEKIQKALRIFAREFDEVKKYIDNIKNTGRLTYDGRGNVPDYFLTDLCEEDGWDVESVMPYDLKGITSYDETALMTNTAGQHLYSQSTKPTILPYAKKYIKDGTEDGYFMLCTGSPTGIKCYLSEWYGTKTGDDCYMRIVKANTSDTQKVLQRCGDKTKRIEQKIKPYTDDTTEYTYLDLNYEFLRRLKLNSRAMWRHKGTLEGVEMILGMFGLKSKRWLNKNGKAKYKPAANNCSVGDCETAIDYDIVEYTQFTTRIEDEWDTQVGMYKYDWLNSTKTITYDYRSISNYTKPGSNGPTYVPYQGIPVSYREPYEGETTEDVRYLYPNFDKNEQIDGNPYFQMDGGWLAKTINGKQNFQFDVDDNIVHNKVETNPRSEGGFIIDNHKLYKETVRSIRRVEDLTELLSLPQNDLYDGIICFVGRVNSSVAVIDGEVFDVEKEKVGEGDTSKLRQFIRFTRKGGFIRIGDLYFDESIVVYDEDDQPTVYSLDDKLDGYEIKAYIKNNGTDETPSYDFICYSSENHNYTFTNFKVIEEGDSKNFSNYYVLDDTVFSDRISHDYGMNGWKRLKYTDPDYLKINTVENYYEGNNGHNGNLHYDSGHEYFTYFQRLFKYAEDNSLFDTRCFREGFDDVYQEVHNIGFQGLINPIEEIKDYDKYLKQDTKVHYFGNYKTTGGAINVYGDSRKYKSDAWNAFYGKEPSYYSIGDSKSIKATGEIQPHTSSDDVTNQIVNNKRIKIIFNMKKSFASKEGQEELKYIDKVVMNYLTQMLPSTVITDIEYNFCNYNYTGC